MDASSNFWTRRTVSRRAALRGAGLGLAGVAGAALIGCGSDDDDAPAPAARQAATAAPTQAGAQATAAATAAPEEPSFLASRALDESPPQPGGIIASYTNTDVTNLDSIAAESFLPTTAGRWVYPQLVEFAPGIGGPPASGDVRPGLAEDWEIVSPLKLILHLRKNAKWDPREPTNSRGVVADDVVFSWNKFKEKSSSRMSVSNDASDLAPIVDITAIDDYTIQVDSAFAFGPLFGVLAYPRWLQIQPQEADGGYDARNDMRGAGPWMLTKYDRSVKFEYRKNPNYWVKDRPLTDGWDLTIIPEYAQQHAQRLAGKIWLGGINAADQISTYEELPWLNVLMGDYYRGNWQVYFGLRPDSPFIDERVRRAVSNLMDRQLIIDTFSNLDEKREAGWPIETRITSVGVSTGYPAFWADPERKVNQVYSPEQAKAFAYDPAEAKKLMEAAGHGDGLKTKFHHIATAQYGSTFVKVGEAYVGMLEATGLFDLDVKNGDYSTEYLPKIYFGQGDFEGIGWGASTIFPHVGQHLVSYYHSGGSRQKVAFQSFDDLEGGAKRGGDPSSMEGTAASDTLIEKAMASLDFDEQVELILQWQADNALRTPMITSSIHNGTPGFGFYPPWVKNLTAYRSYLESSEQTTYPEWWIDEKLKKEILG